MKCEANPGKPTISSPLNERERHRSTLMRRMRSSALSAAISRLAGNKWSKLSVIPFLNREIGQRPRRVRRRRRRRFDRLLGLTGTSGLRAPRCLRRAHRLVDQCTLSEVRQTQHAIKLTCRGRPRQHFRVFEPFDIRQIAEARQSKHFKEFLRRHIGVGRAGFGRASIYLLRKS
jgi:hypothetical protein